MHTYVNAFTVWFCVYLAPLSSCEDRIKMSSGGKLALWNYVPYCRSDGGFQDVQCNAHTGNCWCVNNNGLEFTETRSRKMPNCVTPSESLISFVLSIILRNPSTLGQKQGSDKLFGSQHWLVSKLIFVYSGYYLKRENKLSTFHFLLILFF